MKKNLYTLSNTICSLYTGRNLAWQIVACVLTYIISASGFDWFWFQSMRGVVLQSFLWPAVIVGFLLPVFLPIIIYFVGVSKKSTYTIHTAYALAEAGILGFLFSSFYKVFTGRPGPGGLHLMGQALLDMSHVFRFGFYRGGAFQGWPSSHTAVAFAMSFVLITLYPKNKAIKILAFVYALYIGIGVSTNIHWFSDFVAGAIFGTLIGVAVGKSFLTS